MSHDSHGSHDSSHGDHDMDMSGDTGSSDMSSHSMAMTFFTSGRTALFANSWTPSNDGQYAGTCIFLIVLAVIFRLLLALRPILGTRLWNTRPTDAHVEGLERTDDGGKLLEGRMKQDVAIVRNDIQEGMCSWTIGTAASRATYETVLAGVGYLLMLAVMTMNVGYFMSVLAGVWFGTFMLGSLSY